MNKFLKNNFKGKKVLITGHTGFKGTWLTLWLNKLGAKIVGISKDWHGYPSHFKDLKINGNIKSYFFDLKEFNKLQNVISRFKPDYVFHLAGQSMVKKSYINPYSTFLTNSFGSLNLLEALRKMNKRCYLVMITSDKVYKNLEIKRGYNEKDALGGYDPYSSSKATAEIIISAYSKLMKNSKVRLGIARAGNVIGGGDWNQNRLIPDCMKAWGKGKTVLIRNPNSTRPWQYVLDVVRGYLILSINLKIKRNLNGTAFNFGPSHKENFSVLDIVKLSNKNWKNIKWKIIRNKDKLIHESKLLQLNSSKAKKYLNWECKLRISQSLKQTINWYRNYFKNKKKDVRRTSLQTLIDYQNLWKN